MSVRNLNAIQRHGNMIAEQMKNDYKLKEESLFTRIGIIQSSHVDAVDAVDTIAALNKNGLYGAFENWLKAQNVQYRFYTNVFYICSGCYEVRYSPYDDKVYFTWQDCGMSERYSSSHARTILVERIYSKSRAYNNLLTALAERLQPFLDAFFKWVDTI